MFLFRHFHSGLPHAPGLHDTLGEEEPDPTALLVAAANMEQLMVQHLKQIAQQESEIKRLKRELLRAQATRVRLATCNATLNRRDCALRAEIQFLRNNIHHIQ